MPLSLLSSGVIFALSDAFVSTIIAAVISGVFLTVNTLLAIYLARTRERDDIEEDEKYRARREQSKRRRRKPRAPDEQSRP